MDFGRRYYSTWIAPGSRPMLPGMPDPSTHQDLTTSYDRSVDLLRLPFGKRDYLFLLACASAPMLLYLLQQIPVTEAVKNIWKILG